MAVPSGDQIEISFEEQRAVVVQVGGGLRSYSAGGRDLVDGYAIDEMCLSARGQLLIPWPNRLEDGSYEFDGEHHQVALSEPSKRNAIHGLVRWSSWRVADQSVDRVVMEHVIHPHPGYPFALALRAEYALSAAGLAVCTTAINLGDAACPYGVGAHPYLTVGTTTIDPAVLRLPARTWLRADERDLPLGSAPVDGTELDFRQPRQIGATVMNTCFTDLERDADGLARTVLHDPDGGDSVELWVDESYPYLMVFTGDTQPDVARRSLAVEPMTCPPNAFRSGEALIRLEPGASHAGAWGISPGGSGS